jgi:hypothetical protein
VGGTLTLNQQLSVTGDISLPSYPSLITHDLGVSGASLVLSGHLFVGQGAAVDVSAKGLLAGQTIDPATGETIITDVLAYRSGGSHGGVGGRVGPAIYGVETSPVTLGSGGWSSGWVSDRAVGGAGGGAILIEANAITLAGQILANGEDGDENGNYDGSGGGGGSVWLIAQTLNSGEYVAGSIMAIGGDGFGAVNWSYSGSGGGGGRIAMDITTDNYTGSVSVGPGTGYEDADLAQAGTIVRE